VLAIPYWCGEDHPLFFCSLCPAGALEAGLANTAQLAVSGNELVWPSATKLTIFAVILVAMLFTWRPWCTVLCPLGAIFSLCNFFSFLFVRVRKEDCTHCGLCDRLCRYGSGPLERGGDMQCIRCLDCTQCTRVSVSTILSRTPQSTKPEKDLVSIGGESDA